jgi:hypothetical protein
MSNHEISDQMICICTDCKLMPIQHAIVPEWAEPNRERVWNTYAGGMTLKIRKPKKIKR